MSFELTEIFKANAALFHETHPAADITVDWDVFGKKKEDPDHTCAVAYITTEHLVARSFILEDIPVLHSNLWGKEEVMCLYNDGKPRVEDSVGEFVVRLYERWMAKDPFSGFIVHNLEDDLIGSVILGKSDEPQNSELAYLSVPKFQGKKFGQEYVGAVLFDWTSYIFDHRENLVCASEFRNIVATSHIENAASNRILQKFGFHNHHVSEKYGSLRNHYEMPVVIAGEVEEQIIINE